MPEGPGGDDDAGARVGLTLPTFVDDPEVLVAAARAADRHGLDGVFTYDHLFRFRSDGTLRSALSLEPVLGALAVETDRVAIGTLVARATVRHGAVLASVLDTVARVAPGRLVAGVGSGDRESEPEQEMFGLVPERIAIRLSALEATLESTVGRGYPVWVGGRSDRVVATAAARADGWNGWGLGVEAFAERVAALRQAEAAATRPEGSVVATWGGLVELRPERWPDVAGRDDVLSGSWDGMAAALRRLVEAGAAWVVLAPVAPSDPDNAEVVRRELVARLRE